MDAYSDNALLRENDLEDKNCIRNSDYSNIIKIGCCLSILIFFCLLTIVSLNVLNLLHISPLQNEQVNIKSKETQYHIMLPTHATNDTTAVQNAKKVPYIKVPTTESAVMILILISGYFMTRENTTDSKESNEKDNTFPVAQSLVKGSYSMTNVYLDNDPLLKASGGNISTGVRIPTEGLYYLYACIQVTCYCKSKLKADVTVSEVTHYIQINSGNSNKTIMEKTIQIPHGTGVYKTSNIFVPIRLKGHDVVSMHLSDDSYVYNSRKSNVIGVFLMS
ncbi:unnamed protein product [Mytilus coruscus]|uniref:Uncharacterized protein n=1 Tax=Mytilus coruscus TaxID=42192 RepID=A0A6J8DD42_MYTCO|nr:unnamed protein product [Mytilus coruscus]